MPRRIRLGWQMGVRPGRALEILSGTWDPHQVRRSRLAPSLTVGLLPLLRRVASTAAPAPTSHFISHLLKALPLVGRQDLLQTLVGLLPNLTIPRL